MAKQKTKEKIRASTKRMVQPKQHDHAVAIIPKKETTLSIQDPRQVMAFAKVLQDYIAKNNLSVEIQGRPYAMVSGWQFAGTSFGLTAIPRKPVRVHEKGQYATMLYSTKEFTKKDGGKYSKDVLVFVGFAQDADTIALVKSKHVISNEVTKPYFAYECECDIKRLSDGTVVGYGQGFCSNLESLKSGFDEYSVSSMCQTRSIGKSYRNLLGFIMNAAGYEPTPAEEMEQVNENGKQTAKQNEAPKLPTPNDKQFDGICAKIKKGEVTVKTVEEHFTLTEKQLTTANEIEDNR